MTSAARRKLFLSSLAVRHHAQAAPVRSAAPRWLLMQTRSLANVREDSAIVDPEFFSGSPANAEGPGSSNLGPHGKPKSPDQRTLQLGKTVRVLHEHLPTLLASPLPSEILSPQITLHLFPSTHPHLPTVSGRIAYAAALWTAPVAWGRLPVVGNIRLDITSERMVKNGNSTLGFRCEKLIVRWKTCGKTSKKSSSDQGDQVQKIKEVLRGNSAGDKDEFAGLFVFEFDEDGRIVKHTIEHAEEGGNFEKMTRVVNVTDWLLGLARGKKSQEEHGFALGFCEASRPLSQQDRCQYSRRGDGSAK